MGEREVGDDAERFGGELERQRIGVRDSRPMHAAESFRERTGEFAVELEGEDPAGDLHQLASDVAGAGADLEDEVAARQSGVANEVSRQTRMKEVPPGRTGAARTYGVHGRPP